MTITYRPASDHDWPHIVECWYGFAVGTAQNENIVEQLRAITSPFTAWGAWQDHQLLATVILSSKQIPYVHAWPVRSVVTSRDVPRQLWHTVIAHCRAEGKRFLQTLIPSHETRDLQMMSSLDLVQLTRIERYRRDLLRSGSEAMVTCERWDGTAVRVVLIENYDDSLFGQHLVATFVGSKDVPELNALTQLDPVGSEYEGEHCERLLICTGRGFLGVAVLGVAVLEHVGELASLRYLGLLPETRGQGYAAAAAQEVLAMARKLGCVHIEVRVDVRNTPAIKLYQRAGFTKVDEEVLLYQPLTS